MTEFFAVCAAVATGAVVVAVVSLVKTLEDVRLTAQQARRTALAVENLAKTIDASARDVQSVTGRVHELTDALKFNWLRGLQLGMAFVQNLRERWAAGNDGASAGAQQTETAAGRPDRP